MLHELRYINTSTINGTMAVNEDNYDDDDDKQDEQRGRNKIPHWMMISISCHFIQSIQFICLLANLFEQTMRSRFFYHSWLCAVRLFHTLLLRHHQHHCIHFILERLIMYRCSPGFFLPQFNVSLKLWAASTAICAEPFFVGSWGAHSINEDMNY